MRISLIAVLCLTLSSGQAYGQNQDQPKLPDALIVYDFAGNASTDDTPTRRSVRERSPARTYVFLINDRNSLDVALFDSLEAAIDAPAVRSVLLESIRLRFKTSSKARAFLTSGAYLGVYAFHKADSVAFSHTETERAARIEADAAALAKVVTILPSPSAADIRTDPDLKLSTYAVVLEQSRADVKITAQPVSKQTRTPPENSRPSPITCGPQGPSPQVLVCVVTQTDPASSRGTGEGPPGAATQAQRGPASATSVDLITGSAEHVFLSANAGSSNVLQGEYDEESMSINPKTPTGFFIGVNFSFSDLNKQSSSPRAFIDALYVGAMVEATRRPMDQVALIAGYRDNPIPILRDVLAFDAVSPFVGLLWAKSDTLINEQRERRYGKAKFVWGLNLNIARAVDWLTPKNENASQKQTTPANQDGTGKN